MLNSQTHTSVSFSLICPRRPLHWSHLLHLWPSDQLTASMGSSAEKVWSALLKDVQYTVQHSGAAEVPDAVTAAAAARVVVNAERLAELPPMPRATWKRLIVDFKV